MKNPLVKLTSNESSSKGQPIFVNAISVHGIEPGEEVWVGGDPVWLGSYKTMDRRIKHGARVYFGTTNHSVCETVEECYALFETKL